MHWSEIGLYTGRKSLFFHTQPAFDTLWNMYCPPRLMCVPTLPWRKWIIVKFPRVQQRILVLFPWNFFCSEAQFWYFFAEIHQTKFLKIHVAVWHHTYFWVCHPNDCVILRVGVLFWPCLLCCCVCEILGVINSNSLGNDSIIATRRSRQLHSN